MLFRITIQALNEEDAKEVPNYFAQSVMSETELMQKENIKFILNHAEEEFKRKVKTNA